MKRISKIILIGTSVVLLGGAAAACSHHRGPEQRAEWMVEKMTKKLDLDSTQQTKLQTLSADMLAARKQMHQSFGADRDEVLNLLAQPTLDQAKILDMVRQRTAAVNQEAPKIVSAMAGFYDSLKPEQQAKIREFIKQHHEHGHHRWHGDRDDD